MVVQPAYRADGSMQDILAEDIRAAAHTQLRCQIHFLKIWDFYCVEQDTYFCNCSIEG
ncbi:MAG: hypothetical protein KME43_16775 [Myxacorys chilensis ATA2-1-KO14]|jgi:hypothetical protein|nr:hypothetical protein [Myxacorys chilensis ATA2-1-KO14]